MLGSLVSVAQRANRSEWQICELEIEIRVTGKRQKSPTTARHREMKTGISQASKRVSIFSFATEARGGKQVSFYFRQRNWVQAREAQIQFPAG